MPTFFHLIINPGIFDILAGLWPRPVMIARTIWPAKHRMNMCSCLAAVILTAIGTVGETVVAFFLYGINMHDWPLSIKIATPICHIVFMCAQGYSSWIMLSLARKHNRKLKGLASAEVDVEMSDPDKQDGIIADSQDSSVTPEGGIQRN